MPASGITTNCSAASQSTDRTKDTYRKRQKSSVQHRPRAEWIPLELPKSLHLVPRDRWQRVQCTLKQNIAFSPRNEKHLYLLKGLVRCSGCGARYIGDNWHARFYYRCSSRCGRVPAIRDYRLDNIVVNAVESLFTEHSTTGRPLRRGDLKSVGWEEQRELLRLLVQDAIFNGSTVEVQLPESRAAGGHNITYLPFEDNKKHYHFYS